MSKATSNKTNVDRVDALEGVLAQVVRLASYRDTEDVDVLHGRLRRIDRLALNAMVASRKAVSGVLADLERVPLVSIGPSGIGGEYQKEIKP